jgi:hypothetical protein
VKFFCHFSISPFHNEICDGVFGVEADHPNIPFKGYFGNPKNQNEVVGHISIKKHHGGQDEKDKKQTGVIRI